ncbi:hypothetical protein AB4354_16480 [Vibrio splendidus]|uniref:hypothetical protein n=1 Tax=Vibrio splendidus TaxID=29497 RepID=UPI000978733B|nr:hypothetical protein [Vibrio splendidus]OMO29793.1 hypothetical protein BH581_09445 [Vibrio splendidus]PMH02392.1 hypothetical protein BCU75_05745 [Vibrio splendidus]PMK54398.1 hypothetical protein BCT96_08250 [Vibrio splendidus]|tara:strand:- start:458 stop:724 length:267 start_codon:yes stop_codon:yes gene_type:complete
MFEIAMKILLASSFLVFGLSLTAGPLIISRYKLHKTSWLSHFDNFLIIFDKKVALSDTGKAVQKKVRLVFFSSLLVFTSLVAFLLSIK